MKKQLSRPMRVILQYALIAVLTGLDRLIKVVVEENLRPEGSVQVIKGVLGLRYVQNTGAAFSSFSSNTTLLSIFTGAIILGGLVYLALVKKPEKVYSVVVPIVLAGGLGNLVDRLIQGYVTDYIEVLFVNFAVFNFADILVTCGCGVLVVALIYSIASDKK